MAKFLVTYANIIKVEKEIEFNGTEEELRKALRKYEYSGEIDQEKPFVILGEEEEQIDTDLVDIDQPAYLQ